MDFVFIFISAVLDCECLPRTVDVLFSYEYPIELFIYLTYESNFHMLTNAHEAQRGKEQG